MAFINKGAVIREMIKKLGLQPADASAPKEIAGKIVPVFDVAEKGTPRVVKFEGADDNDKTYVVPDGQFWKIEGMHIDFTCDAVVGNRSFVFEIQDPDGSVVWATRIGASLTASTQTDIIIQPSVFNAGALTATSVTACPSFIKEGFTLRWYDEANVSAGDDMLVHVWYHELSADEE